MPKLHEALNSAKIAVIGLGYVGLPLALAFGQQRPTLGFDIEPPRVSRRLFGLSQAAIATGPSSFR